MQPTAFMDVGCFVLRIPLISAFEASNHNFFTTYKSSEQTYRAQKTSSGCGLTYAKTVFICDKLRTAAFRTVHQAIPLSLRNSHGPRLRSFSSLPLNTSHKSSYTSS